MCFFHSNTKNVTFLLNKEIFSLHLLLFAWQFASIVTEVHEYSKMCLHFLASTMLLMELLILIKRWSIYINYMRTYINVCTFTVSFTKLYFVYEILNVLWINWLKLYSFWYVLLKKKKPTKEDILTHIEIFQWTFSIHIWKSSSFFWKRKLSFYI